MLPIPFYGRQARGGVVFLGANPSYDGIDGNRSAEVVRKRARRMSVSGWIDDALNLGKEEVA
jgi:hypothetical protein